MNFLNKTALLLLALAISGAAHSQHAHHDSPSDMVHQNQGAFVYDDQGLGFEVFSDPRLDLTQLSREGVFQGSEIFLALSEDARFDFRYCPELQGEGQPSNPLAEFVVFCISKGTELGPWNLSESQKLARDGSLEPALDKTPRFGPVDIKAGQTLRLINLDSGENGVHRMHVLDKPCYHQPRFMTPALYSEDGELLAATYYDCPIPLGLTWDSEKDDGSSYLYNHQTKQPFYLRVTSEEVP